MAIAYGRLRDYLGLPKKPIRVYDMVQQLAVIDTDVLDRFGVDTVELGRGFSMDEAEWKEWVLPDGSPCLIPSWVDVRKKGDDWYIHNPAGNPCGLQRKGMLYFDQIYWPYKEGIPDDLSGISEAIGNIVWSVPSPPHVGNIGIDGLAKGAREFRASTDRAIVFLFGGNLLEMSSFLCSIENAMMWMALEPRNFTNSSTPFSRYTSSTSRSSSPPYRPRRTSSSSATTSECRSDPSLPDMYRGVLQPRRGSCGRG
jgi:uroporphyrinogen decarboxylase